MFKIVLFDLDGTLIDSSDDICDGVNYALKVHQKDMCDKSAIMCHVGVGASYLIEKVLGLDAEDSIVEAVLNTYLEYYGKHSMVKTKLYEGVLNVLKRDEKTFGVITNKPSGVGNEVIKKLGIDCFLQWKIFCDTYSVLKPDPKALLEIIKEVGCDREDILYVGDTGIDLKFAKNAGVKSCLFNSGFGAISTYSELKPDFEINHFDELSSLF